jgi:hypothetical protein
LADSKVGERCNFPQKGKLGIAAPPQYPLFGEESFLKEEKEKTEISDQKF